MAKMICEVCGYVREAQEPADTNDQPQHCGQQMKHEE